MRLNQISRRTLLAALTATLSSVSLAQQPRQFTAGDYAAAEKFMSYNVNPLAYKGQVDAHWADDAHFWYREAGDDGVSYILVDPAKGTRGAAFDQNKLAALLNTASKGAIKSDGRH